MTTMTVKVPNISCNHCVHTIKVEVGDIPGVKSVEGSVDTRLVTIGYDDPATREQIEALLAEIDYPVE
ncbi:MAG TPA: heavy-metal-associated domain-containing protein [Anaerolineales bacterium]|nr:heavy-metal-associated domain-containing protein [Anaerolineales bacterium]